MNRNFKSIIKQSFVILFVLFFSGTNLWAQKKQWDLKTCIDYALENNIQVKQTELQSSLVQESLLQAKAQRLPNLTFNSQLNLTQGGNVDQITGNYEPQSSQSANYSLSSGLTLYNGGKIKNTISQQELTFESSLLNVEEAKNNIVIAITQAYLQVLYQRESLKNAQNTLELSKLQLEQSQKKLDAGASSPKDYIQMEAQYSGDFYKMVTAQNSMDLQVMKLKQLLELSVDEKFEGDYPRLDNDLKLPLLPAKHDVYAKALEIMPEIKSAGLDVKISELELKKAQADYLPVLSLNGSMSSGYSSNFFSAFSTQTQDNFNVGAGFVLKVPIFNKRQARTNEAKAQINIETTQLSLMSAQKNLLQTVESAYQNAFASRSRLDAAGLQQKANEKSYAVAQEEYKLGMMNTTDLLTEKNRYQNAQQEYVQAKYSAILNYKLLDFYQGNQIEL